MSARVRFQGSRIFWRLIFLFGGICLGQVQAQTSTPEAVREALEKANAAPLEAQGERFSVAVALARQLADGEEVLLAKCLNEQGIFCYDTEDLACAEQAFREALRIRKKVLGKHALKTAESHGNLGNCLSELGEYAASSAQYKESIQIYTQLGRQEDVAETLIAIAGNTRLMGSYAEALAYLDEARGIAESLSSNRLLGSIAEVRGTVHYHRGWLKAAQKAFLQAMDYYGLVEEGRRDLINICQFNLALVYTDLGMAHKALEVLAAELEFQEAKPLRNHDYIASNYNMQGVVHFNAEHYGQAEIYFRKACDVVRLHLGAAHFSLAHYYTNLGNALAEQGDASAAILAYQQAGDLTIAQFSADHSKMSLIYSNLGQTYFDLGGQDSLAFSFFRRSLALERDLAEADRSLGELAERYLSLGNALVMRGRFAEAMPLFRAVLALEKDFLKGDRAIWAKAYAGVGDCWGGEGEFPIALAAYDSAQAILTKGLPDSMLARQVRQVTGTVWSELALLNLLGKKAEVQEKLAFAGAVDRPMALSALFTLEIATDLEFRIRQKYLEGASIKRMRRETQALYAAAVRICFRLQAEKNEDAEQLRSRAFYFSEKSRASWLQHGIHAAHVLEFAGLPAADREAEMKLKEEMVALGKLISEEKFNPENADTSKLNHWEKRLRDIRIAYEALMRKMERESPDYYRLKYQRNLYEVADFQAQFLNKHPSTLLLEYFWGDSAVYAFALQGDKLRMFRIGKLHDLETALAAFQGELSGLDRQVDHAELFRCLEAPGHFLYEQLVAPACTDMSAPIRELLIVPDGPLHQVPFGALLTAPGTLGPEGFAGLPYLLRQYSLRYAYSGSLLLDEARRARPRLAPIPFMAFAPNMPPLHGQAVELGNLAPLRHAQEEAAALHQLMGGDLLTNREAQESTFKDRAGNARILHLAAHAIQEGGFRSNPAIVLNTDKASGEDGRLHSSELYNVALNADLAVLSACQTGRGETVPGEGAMSLARAFYYSGCAAVVMSLWSSNDAATSDLMLRFYRELQAGQAKAEALRQAKLAYLDQATFLGGHPHFWAAFVLTGNGEPLARPQSWAAWGLGAAVGLVALLGLWGWRRRSRIA